MKKLLATILSLLTISTFAQQIDFTPANDGQTFLTCNGFVIDSGNQGGPGYSNNENYEITICPDTITTGDPSLYITVTFNFFQLDGTNTGTQQNPNVDFMAVYDGTSSAAPTLGTYTTNGLQGVSIAATNLNPSGCLTFVFYSNSVGTGQFTASATCTQPCVPPTADGFIVGGDTPDSIRVCVGDPVSFDGSGSFAAPGFNIQEYSWNFMDGTIDNTSGSTVTHSFNAPGQYQVQLTLTDDNTDNVCNNLNVVPLKVYVSNYPTFYEFPSDTTICLGESVTFEGITNFGQYDSTWTGFPQSNAVDDGCLPDTLLGISQTIPLTYAQFDPSATVQNINDIQNICINMEHSYMGDLVIQLTCPNGTTINLQTQGGGGTQIGVPDQADNVDCPNQTGIGQGWDYCWDATATQTWTDWVNAQGGWGLTLPQGNYASVDPLSDLIGCPLNGQWQITVIDNWAADDGTIFEFGVTFDPSFYPNIIQFTNTVGEGSDSSYWDMTDPWITNSDPDLNWIDVTPGAAGTFDYTYYCVNNFGCEFDSTVTLTVTDNPLADAGLDTSLCGGGATSVQLNGGIGAGGGGATCDYVLDLIDTFGDTWNGNTIDVTINGVTTNYTENNGAQTTIILPVTHGDQITLQWNATGNWQSENEFYLYDGNGTLIYSDGENFATPSTNPVTFTADCFGGVTFEWTPAATLDDPNSPTPNASPTTSTDYVLTVYPTGHPLCFTTDTVTVDMGGASDAGIDSTAYLCADAAPVDLFTYVGGTPQANGTWQEAGTGNPVTMPFDPATMAAGDYEYHVDSLGCTSFSTITVVLVSPTSSNVVIDSDCGACNGEVTLTGADGLGSYEFSMDNGATYQPAATFAGLCPGDHYFVVRDSIGCTINDTATVVEINPPSIAFNDTTSTDCGGATGDISVNTNSGTAPFQFGLVGGALQADSTITGLGTGTYDVVLVDNFGCSDTLFGIVIDSINVPDILDVTATDVDCNSANNGMVDISGNHITNFSINGGAFQGTGSFTGLAPGNYTVLVENDFGCQDSATFSITEPTPLDVQVTSPVADICIGETTTLTAQGSGGNGGPYTYDWYEGTNLLGQGASFDVSPNISNLNYCVVISEACGSPVDTACTTVNVEQAPVLSFTGDILSGCYPIDVEFTNTSQGAIANSTWYFGDGTSEQVVGTSSVIHTYTGEGLFDVTLEVESVSGCIYDTTYFQYVEAFGYPNANMTFSPNPVSMYDPEVQFQDISTGDDIISWTWGLPGGSPASSTDQHPATVYPEGEPGVYPVYLTVTNIHGCTDSASTQVVVTNDVLFYAPNAFTPDGDAYNDTWQLHIEGIDFYDFNITIFNRWGEIVWESNNPEVGWNGTFQGNLVQDGTYVWIMKCKDQWTDEKYTFNGHVTVIR